MVNNSYNKFDIDFTVHIVYTNRAFLSIARDPFKTRVWSKEHSRSWWNAVCEGKFGSVWWKENLRMEKATFDFLCQEIRPHIEKQVGAL